MQSVTLFNKSKKLFAKLTLPASKSESNRALLIQALSGAPIIIQNLSQANDTLLFKKIIEKPESALWDAQDAGTTLRFATVLSVFKYPGKIITGTPRMCHRPVEILVTALQQLGADIDYVEKKGFPPLHVKSFNYSGLKTLTLNAGVSSQFISALAMAAPLLPDGLTLVLAGKTVSSPYISMTLNMMQEAGAQATMRDHAIEVKPGGYASTVLEIENDWSAAGYWYAMLAMCDEGELYLYGLRPHSKQGDAKLATLMEQFGVKSFFEKSGVRLVKSESVALPHFIDFTDIPDQAQTILPLCIALRHSIKFTGVETLQHKETHRLEALNEAFKKLGGEIIPADNDTYMLKAPTRMPQQPVYFKTYDDHRMAMGLSLFSFFMPVTFDKASVVAKSYPDFWQHCLEAGFDVVYN